MDRLFGNLAEVSRGWDEIDYSVIPENKKQELKARVKAVKMYIGGYKLNEIQQQTGVHYSRITYYVKRCMEFDEEGNMLGYAALIPYRKLKSGSKFQNFAESEQDITRRIVEKFFKKRTGPDKHISVNETFKMFLAELRKSGRYTIDDYPFTLSDCGRRNFYRLLAKFSLGFAPFRMGTEAMKLFKTTSGHPKLMSKPLQPFQVVEMDGHKIDAIWSIEIPKANGDTMLVNTERVWILANIDVATRAIVGYSLSLSRNYDQFDVLECLESSIVPYKPITDIDAVLPSNAIPEAKWAMFNEVHLDNAKAHLAKSVLAQTEKLGCSFVFGPVATPVMRPHIERFFGTLEEMCYHRLPSTTGSNPSDVRRNNAEKEAIHFKVTIDMLMDLTEQAVAAYNNRPHDGLGGFTPLEVMKQRIGKGLLPRQLPIEMRTDFALTHTIKRVVRGSMTEGVRPYVQYLNNRYSSPKLAETYRYHGKTVTLVVDPKNVCKVKAYLEDGSFIDELTVKNLPNGTVISQKQMQLTNAFRNKKKTTYLNTESIVKERMDKLAETAVGSKKNATDYARAKTTITMALEEPAEAEPDEDLYSQEELEEMMKLMYGTEGED